VDTDRFEIIDMHLHAWWEGGGSEAVFDPHQLYNLDEQVFLDTLSQMDNLGIRVGLISGANNVTAEGCRRAPGRFIALWWPKFESYHPDEEVERFIQAIEVQGFRGLSELVPQYSGFPPNDQRFFPLYRICEERGLPVSIHTGLSGPDYLRAWPLFRANLGNPLLLEDVAVAFPHLKIVMAHLSFPFSDQAAYMLYAHSNVYLDVSVVNWILGKAGFHRLLREVVELVGADKILYGSDQMGFPQMIPFGVGAIREAPFLSEEDKRKILGDNARKLLGINVNSAPR
jgi:uncharacterized protein